MIYRQTESSKDNIIKELKEVESNLLIVEILNMKKQIEKLKNIAANMQKELTTLKSNKS